MSKKLTTEEFIIKARGVHGDKYDYSKVVYVNNSTPITIICSEHGDFKQIPSSHLIGQNCSKCKGGIKLTQSEWINRAKKIHGDKYDYSKVIYINSQTKIIIICSVHGEFEQQPSKHLTGQNCPKCYDINEKRTTESFIKKAKEVHGDKYDYSKVVYVNNSTPITIICSEHGDFKQIPSSHLIGQNCPKCKGRGFEYSSYNDVKILLKPFNLQNQDEFYHWWKNNEELCRENGIPSYPYRTYGKNNMKEESNVWVSWYDFLGQPEPVNSKKNKLELINSIKDTDLLTMDPYELMVIIGQGNLPDEIRNLLDTDAGTPDRMVAIQNVIDELTDQDDEFIDDNNVVVNEVIEDNNITQVDDIDNVITDDEDDEPTLPIISTVDEFRSLDNSIYTSMDEEAIESLIQYKFHKLWNYVLNDQISVDKIKSETGGEYFNIIKNAFLKEYNDVNEWTPKDNYSNYLIPNLMQKVTVHRLLTYKSYGNWSGTGAGKTLSFILSSREIDAKITLIIVVNSTTSQIGQSILDAYPDSLVHYNYHKGQVFDRTRHNYLILNYEKFQQDYSEERFQSLTNDNLIDFVVIDEVHNAKQRQGSDESIRRGVLNRLMGRIRENNPNLYTSVMSATPVINDLFEAKSLLKLLTGKEYDDIETRRTLNNALKIYQQLFLNGLRFKPRYDLSVQELTGHNTPELNIDGTYLADDLISNRINLLGTEVSLLDEKLIAIEPYLRKGVIIYSHYVDNIINKTKEYVEGKGFSVERYTGEESLEYRTEVLNSFINGDIDILIASDPITTGVDGLQKVCNRMIILTLPWTDSIYTQLKGRIYRQGFNPDFNHVEIIIPQVRIDLGEGEFWSWDVQRLNLIKNKRTLADAAVDGLIPSKILPTKETMYKKAIESLVAWKERCNNGNHYTFERENTNIDLYPELSEEERTRRINSELMEFNRRGKTTLSSTMNKEFNNDPESFFRYHKIRRESMKDWNEIPYEYIANQIKDTTDVVIDFGCGDNQFKNCIPNNKVISVDHISFDDTVIACDMKDLSEHINDRSVDIAVFSLSLWGTNYRDYLKEAHRVLIKRGLIYIAEPIHNYETEESNKDLINLIKEAGFEIVGNIERRSKFIYITGIKN